MRTTNVKVGTFNVGLQRYWMQFPGLEERLAGYHKHFVKKLEGFGVDVVCAGLVDTMDKARRAAQLFRSHDVDVIFCNVTTYVYSSVVLPIAKANQVPFILVGLQPTARMDYPKATTYEQLAHDNCTSLPEIGYALTRAGIPYSVLFGRLEGDERVWKEIGEWCQVAKVLHDLRYADLGFLGHTYEGMLDMYFDPTDFHTFFGQNIKMIEMCDLKERVDAVTDSELQTMLTRIRDFFEFPAPGADPIAGPVSDDVLEYSAKVAQGLEQLVEDFELDGMAYYYAGIDGHEYERLAASLIIGNSLLTGRGIPIAGEGDMKNCVAMLIMDRLGAGGSFAELHPVDFEGDFVLVGHDGPGHIRISDQKPILRGLSLYHGKKGYGASVEFKVKTGPVTILGLTQTYEGRFKFVVAEGESIPGLIPATGNTNSRVRFPIPVHDFIEKWAEAAPTHHFALGVGHCQSQLKKLARALDIEMAVIA
ncbi:MAG: arabinose isomerase [Firmicutes bacterium]|nr:arabinose isomerase [Bacillota bacterium]